MNEKDVAYCGCIPNRMTPQVVADIKNSAVPWDAEDVPPVTDWSSLEADLLARPDCSFQWWQAPGAVSLFTPSQGKRPNCAGFSLANATMSLTLVQRYARNSEQKPEAINPMVTWQLSKGGSVIGGQSIAAMAQAGNKYGNYMVKDVGKYDPGVTFRTTDDFANVVARLHQVGISLYDGDDPAGAVLLACRKGLSCMVGNDRAVCATGTDEKGVEAAAISGSWAHATAFCGWKNVDGKNYVFWMNSHGDIYRTKDGTPAFGCWMGERDLKLFLGGSFADVCVLTYAEATYDDTLKPTLEVK